MSEPIEGHMAHVSGRGYGKTQMMRELAQATDKPVLHAGTNYSAQMSFTREASDDGPLGSWEEWINAALGMKLAPWQSRVLGQFQETPREELLRRLNAWARGTYPGLPINWKGL